MVAEAKKTILSLKRHKSMTDYLPFALLWDWCLNDCNVGAQSLWLWIKLTANSSMEETEVISSLSSKALSPYLSPPPLFLISLLN